MVFKIFIFFFFITGVEVVICLAVVIYLGISMFFFYFFLTMASMDGFLLGDLTGNLEGGLTGILTVTADPFFLVSVIFLSIILAIFISMGTAWTLLEAGLAFLTF
jgi:hypothetical protein